MNGIYNALCIAGTLLSTLVLYCLPGTHDFAPLFLVLLGIVCILTFRHWRLAVKATRKAPEGAVEVAK